MHPAEPPPTKEGENVASDEELLTLLRSIDRRLALLTASQDREVRVALEDQLFRTPARIAMFNGINGVRTSPELAKIAKVSDRAAQLFVKELLDLGIVRPAPSGGGRTVIVERDDAGIIRWHVEWTASG
jgi:Fic family protein